MRRHTSLSLLLSKRKNNTGFTLLEILVAVLILSIMAIIMLRGLQTVLSAKEHVEAANKRLSQLQLTMLMIEKDLQQIVNRPIINNRDAVELAVYYDSSQHILHFTRAGYSNPLGSAQRSTLQRVSYQLQDSQSQHQQLIRITWPVLDRVPNTVANKRVLLTHIRALHWRFLGPNGNFYDTWPANNSPRKVLLPSAIEFTITFAKQGGFSQLFVLNAYNKKVTLHKQGKQKKTRLGKNKTKTLTNNSGDTTG
ncbi:MAG: type II secretion system minor pseudopilin GspJ [Gammaproteobacteria bacterium]|nr:type II secretion system minor pseudopilin GspJ [Gammaproteobacteria bacterium]